MLKDIIDNDLIEARGIIGFYPCNSNGEDDIEVYDYTDPSKVAAKFCTIR
jgi:5-methyltetrahydrofolate--homocysteine methyltransferase